MFAKTFFGTADGFMSDVRCGAMSRLGSGKQRIPPACRRGDLQSLDGDWLEPVAATFAYLRRVDGVDVQDIVLPRRVAVEPKPPAVAGEGDLRAL